MAQFNMRCLIIGLGSMGKRRIRCLKSLGYNNIEGFDIRKDRREEAALKYSIKTFDNYSAIDLGKMDLIIISTPPDHHLVYASDAVQNKVPCFIEASVIIEDVSRIIDLVKNSPSYVAPSCTLRFHPEIERIKQIVETGEYGKVTNFSYHCGQYLPDWHPWEQISEYYVSKRETGGAREIVPFELTWLTDVFGFPESGKGFFRETMDLGVYLENCYSFSLKFHDFLGAITIDVVSRFATRSLILNFERAQLRWNWEERQVKIFDPLSDKWELLQLSGGEPEIGYNKNIIEEMYICEIKAFIEGIHNPLAFPNKLEDDVKVLKILNQIEDCDGGFNERLQQKT
jgi:predicted dehydrogenase